MTNVTENEGLLGRTFIRPRNIPGRKQFLEVSVALQASSILYVWVCIYLYFFFRLGTSIILHLQIIKSCLHSRIWVFGLTWFSSCDFKCPRGSLLMELWASALRRIKELILGYFLQGNSSGGQHLCRKRERGEEKGQNWDYSKSWNRSCSEDCSTNSNMISCCVFKNNHLPCLFSAVFSTLCS